MYEHGALMLFFQFYNDKQAEITFGVPYNVRLLEKDNRILPNIDSPETRFPFEIHAVDGNKVLRVIRRTTMPPDMTLAYLDAVQDQLVRPEKPGIMKAWQERRPDYLIKQAQAWVLDKWVRSVGTQ